MREEAERKFVASLDCSVEGLFTWLNQVRSRRLEAEALQWICAYCEQVLNRELSADRENTAQQVSLVGYHLTTKFQLWRVPVHCSFTVQATTI